MADVIGGIEVQLQGDEKGLTEAFNRARTAMAGLEAEARRLKAEEQQGIITTADYAAKITDLTVAQGRLAAAMAQAAPRLNAVNSALASGAGGMRNFGQGVLMVSQGIEDLQYGFSAIVNNIPSTLMAFGAGAGLAGTVSLVAVGINVLIRNFDELMGLFGQAATLTEAERMDQLAKATSRTADEQNRLNQYKRDQKTIEAQSERRPKAEAEVGRVVADAIGEAGAAGLKQKIAESLYKDIARNNPLRDAEVEARLGKEIAASGGTLGGQAAVARRAAIRLQMEGEREGANRKAAAEAAALLLSHAETGPGQMGEDARKQIGKLLPGPEGDVFRRQTAEGRNAAESARLIAEGEAGAAAYDAKVKQRGLERDFSEAQGGMAAEAGRRAEAAQGEAIVRQKVEDQKAENARREALNAEKNREFRGNIDDIARLKERGSDLDWRLRLLLNPEKVGQSMGIAEYGRSFKATTGISEEARRLHAIEEILKERLLNQNKLKVIAVAKP